jgi:hypothetical protein
MPPIDYATGTPQDPRLMICLDMRRAPSLCGHEGRYWEARA